MTTNLKAKIMLAVLKLAPLGASQQECERMATAGNVPGIWRYYQNSLAKNAALGKSAQSANEVSFEMLELAMKAIYKLPTSDGRD